MNLTTPNLKKHIKEHGVTKARIDGYKSFKYYTLEEDRLVTVADYSNSKLHVDDDYKGTFEIVEPVVEQYKCPSYYNDDRELVDCSCGKCHQTDTPDIGEEEPEIFNRIVEDPKQSWEKEYDEGDGITLGNKQPKQSWTEFEMIIPDGKMKGCKVYHEALIDYIEDYISKEDIDYNVTKWLEVGKQRGYLDFHKLIAKEEIKNTSTRG